MPPSKRRPLHTAAAVLAAASFLSPVSGWAQDATTTADTTTAEYNFVEPEALKALTDMSNTLRDLPQYAIEVDATNETVLETGQKLQFNGKVFIYATPPTRMRISIRSDEKNRDFYYDGKTVTVVAPRLKYYATVAAPGTIKETIDALYENFGIEIPLADLFLWSTDPRFEQRLISGYVVRPQTINGKQCMQYAFRQASVDWQIWLPTSGTALPCKMVITDTDDPSMPQYVAYLKWNTAAPAAADTYAFKPTSDFHKIPLARDDVAPDSASGGQ